MKWFHIKMLQLCVVLAQSALTVFCDPVEDLKLAKAGTPTGSIRAIGIHANHTRKGAGLPGDGEKWAPIHEAF